MLKSKQGAFQIINSVEMFKPISKFTKQARRAPSCALHFEVVSSAETETLQQLFHRLRSHMADVSFSGTYDLAIAARFLAATGQVKVLELSHCKPSYP